MISASLAYREPYPPHHMSRCTTSGWSSPWPSLFLKWLSTHIKRVWSWNWTCLGSPMILTPQCSRKCNRWNCSMASRWTEKNFAGEKGFGNTANLICRSGLKRRMIHCEQLLDRVLPFSAAGLLSLQSDSLDHNQRSATDCAPNEMQYWVIIGGHTWGIGGFS